MVLKEEARNSRENFGLGDGISVGFERRSAEFSREFRFGDRISMVFKVEARTFRENFGLAVGYPLVLKVEARTFRENFGFGGWISGGFETRSAEFSREFR